MSRFLLRGALALASAALLATAWSPGRAQAPNLPDDIANAVVKIAAIDDDGHGTSGSGAVIDSRGYVLTAFRTVGRVEAEDGIPGTLINTRNHYPVAAVRPGEDSARYRWVATVVRGNVRLDLALLRIVAQLGGGPLRTPFFEVLPGRGPLSNGDSARVAGYPVGSIEARAVSTRVARATRNAYHQPDWMDLAGGVDPGMIGAPVIDARGRQSGVVVNEGGWARPVARIPGSWREALEGGAIRDIRIEGIRQLELGSDLRDATWSPARPRERRYYDLPAARPLRVRVTPPLPLGVFDASGRIVASGRGTVEVEAGDGGRLVLGVSTPERPTAYLLRAESDESQVARTDRQDPWRAQLVQTDTGFFTPPPVSAEEAARGPVARIRGTMVDALTGRGISDGTVLVGPPDMDLGAHLRSFLTGHLSSRAFRERLVGHATTDFQGRFLLREIPVGRGYSVAAFAPSYRPAMLAWDVPRRSHVNVSDIRMTR